MKIKMDKKSVIQSLYRFLLIFNILFIVGLCAYYGYRTIYYYDLEHNPKQQIKSLSETITAEEHIVYAGDGLYPDGDGYRFIGQNVQNYVYYSGMLWRVIRVNEDSSITMITDENVSSLVWGYDTNQFEDSYINEWLNPKEGVEHSGYFYQHLSNPDNFLVTQTTCVDVLDKAKESCEKTYTKGKIGLLSTSDYLKAGGTNSYLNNHTYFWTSNGSDDGKVWYVFDKGGFNNLSSSGDNYYSYGVRPVITINGKTALKSGTGTVDDPYMIETLNYKNLKSSTSGQYVTYANSLWRIVDVEADKVKVVLEDTLKSEEGVIKKVFSPTTNTYDPTSWNNIGYYLNENYASTLDTATYQAEGPWYTGAYNTDTKFDYKQIYSTSTNSYIGLLHMGELFLHDISSFTTLTPSNTYEQTVITVNEEGMIYSDLSTNELSIRPAIYLKANLSITGGNGMKNSPFVLGGPTQ